MVVTIAGIFGVWELVRPKLDVQPKENPPNAFNADFIVANKGMFTLTGCAYEIFAMFSHVPGVVTDVPGKNAVRFQGPPDLGKPRVNKCDDIPPGQARTIPYPLQFATDQWQEDAFVCFTFSFRGYFRFLDRMEIDPFCFSAEKKLGADHWVPRSPSEFMKPPPQKK